MTDRAAWIALAAGVLAALLVGQPSRQTLFDLALLGAVIVFVVGLVTRRERLAIVGGVVAASLLWWVSQ